MEPQIRYTVYTTHNASSIGGNVDRADKNLKESKINWKEKINLWTIQIMLK